MKFRKPLLALAGIAMLTGISAKPADAVTIHRFTIEGNVDMLDSEDFGSDVWCRNRLLRAEQNSDHTRYLSASVADRDNKCDGEIRVEVEARGTLSGERFCNIQMSVLLYEGASTSTNDLDGRVNWNGGANYCINRGQWLYWTDLRVSNTDEGGDYALVDLEIHHL